MVDVKEVVLGFFKGIRCQIESQEDYFILKNIPERFEKSLGLKSPVKVCFNKNFGGCNLINENSPIFYKILSFLNNSSSKTLLRIDFDLPSNIREMIRLRNCSLSKIEKKQENNYFSRFTFISTLRSMNKTDQFSTEIFVHEGKIVKGNLNDYKVSEGDAKEASFDHLEADYSSAKDNLKLILKEKVSEFGKDLNNNLKMELERINEHYNTLLREFLTNKNNLIKRISLAESNNDVEKLSKLKETLAISFSDKEETKIINERDSVLANEKAKYSIDIDNKLVNTTIIYYPVFKIQVTLSEVGFSKDLELIYNPLTEQLSQLNCDSCKTNLDQINVCHGGHICCSSCLHLCNECGKRYCRLCFAGVCDTCGKLICKNCARICPDCGALNCRGCMRQIGNTRMEKCPKCVVYCPTCSKVVDKKYLVRAADGRMICKDCSLNHRKINSF